MKRVIILLLAVAITGSTWSQQADSLAVVQKNWKTTRLARGLVWKQGHFDTLFGSQQEINFVTVNLKKYRRKLGIGADAKQLKKTSDFAKAHQALVAINGGFFDMKNGGAVDFIQVDGQVVNPSREQTDRVNALLAFSRRKLIIEAGDAAAAERAAADYPNVLSSGPLLLLDGRDQLPGKKSAFNDNRHPRTAIALKGKNELILLIVDGRNARAQGMSLAELSALFRWLGAHTAMNLDGGGSSTLYIKGQSLNGVINYPSDNKAFDHKGQRSVANILYIRN